MHKYWSGYVINKVWNNPFKNIDEKMIWNLFKLLIWNKPLKQKMNEKTTSPVGANTFEQYITYIGLHKKDMFCEPMTLSVYE